MLDLYLLYKNEIFRVCSHFAQFRQTYEGCSVRYGKHLSDNGGKNRDRQHNGYTCNAMGNQDFSDVFSNSFRYPVPVKLPGSCHNMSEI